MDKKLILIEEILKRYDKRPKWKQKIDNYIFRLEAELFTIFLKIKKVFRR